MKTIIEPQEDVSAGSMKAYIGYFLGENAMEPRKRLLVFATSPKAALKMLREAWGGVDFDVDFEHLEVLPVMGAFVVE